MVTELTSDSFKLQVIITVSDVNLEINKGLCRNSSPKYENLMFICLPKGIQDVGDFVSSVEHKWRFLTQTVAVCQSYNVSQWYPRLWERKKTYTDKTKPNSIYIIFYLWSAANCPELVHTTVVLDASSSSSCFTADRRLISTLPPPISQMDHWHSIYNLN